MQRELSLTQGNVFRSLTSFALPFLAANFLQALYGAADLFVVGLFADSASVSAVATGSQIMQTITSIIAGLTTGGTVMIGQYVGAKRNEDAAKTVGTIICLFLMIAVGLTALMLAFVRPITTVMQAPLEAYDFTVLYVTICATGIVCITGYNAVSGILRGLGDSRLPLLFIAVACVVNIIGDLVLTGMLGLGVAGVAIATIGAQAISLLFAIIMLCHKGLMFPFHRSDIRLDGQKARKILALGAPIALQDTMVNVSFLMITAIINSLGLIASAAVGIVERLIGFAFLPPSAYSAAVSVFTAQNVGARQLDRAKKGLWYGIGTSFSIGLVVFIVVQFFSKQLVGIFTTDLLVIEAGSQYLRSYSIDCLLVCFVFCLTGFLNGCSRTLFVMVQSLAQTFIVRIPVTYALSRLAQVSMFDMGLAAPAASVFGIILCLIYLRTGRWRTSI